MRVSFAAAPRPLELHVRASLRAPRGTLDAYFARRGRALVILDECEGVADPLAASLARWRAAAPDVLWLVTSRRPLGLRDERVIPLAGLAPDAPLLETPHGDFSSDPAVIADMDRDPLIFAAKGPARTARAAIDGVARVWAHPEAFRAPLLALHGTIDKLTAPSGSRDLVARAGAADKTLRVYPGLNHDLLHEPDGAGAQVASEIEAWLVAHAGGPAVTFAASPTTQPLKGDHGASVVAVELDVRAEAPRDVDDVAITGGLRLRAGVGRAGPGLGYLGGLDLRAGYLDGGHYELDGHLAGLALRSTGGALLAVSGGVGVGGVRGAGALDAPVELAVARHL